jgi:hypothetical protein
LKDGKTARRFLVGRFHLPRLEASNTMRENTSRLLMRPFGTFLLVTCSFLVLVNLPVSAEQIKRGLPRGVWGGQHISFEVSINGTKVEYDCAHATIDRPIVLDQNGRFNVPGRQFQERGGPVRQGEQTGYAVTFSGEVKGKTMTLTVQNSSTKEDIGTFTLVHGAQPKLVKCL